MIVSPVKLLLRMLDEVQPQMEELRAGRSLDEERASQALLTVTRAVLIECDVDFTDPVVVKTLAAVVIASKMLDGEGVGPSGFLGMVAHLVGEVARS